MDKTLSKDQLKEIMNSAPAGVDKTKLFRKYVDSGYQIEGYNTPEEQGLGSKLVDRAKNIGKEVATFGTLGMSTLDPNTPKDQQDLAVVGGLAQAGAAPARALIQAGGAVGDVVGAGLEATGLDKVISKVVSPVVKPVVQSEAFKKASDAFSMLPEETQTLLKGLPEVANLFGVSPAASIVKKGVTNAVTSTGEAIAKRSAQTAIKDASKIDNLAGTIVQGKADDILKAKKALTDIDITGIKTYKDLVSTLDDKITSLSTGLDEVLSTKPTPKALDDLNLNVKVGDQSVTHNYVKDAVSQLDDLYTKTNNIEGKTKIAQLLQKAEAEGLTIKEVNDLARLHGKELNAFNANGQAASGLTKQAAENTRVGLKSTARDLFDDPVYKQTDTEISNLIRTRDLVDGVSEKVNQLKQRIQERSLGAKVGVALGRAINLLSLGSAKGIVEALIPRGQGFKVMNALDLEEALGANLKKLQKALEGKSEAEIIKNLESIQASKVNLATSKNAINNTNSNIQTQSTPTTPKSKGIRGMINIDEIINSFKKDPVYKNFTQDIVGTSKVEKGNLLNVKDSGRYAWRAGRDASLLVDNVDLPDNAFRSIVGKSREDVISSLEENINKFNSEKGSVPPTDVKKINEVMDYVDRVKSELLPKKAVSGLEQEAKGKTLDEFVNSFEKRFHQTSPEIESKIQKEGFKIGNLGSGSSDVLPVGVNTKMTNEELSLLAKGSQIESYFPKNTKIKTFESRNDAEQFFKDNIPEYWENMNKVSELDAKNVKIHKEMMRKIDDIASTNPGREAIRNENSKIKLFLENWQNEDLALLKKAQEVSTKYAKEQGWDVLQINKDVGGFNRITDNTIVLNPKLLKTKPQLTDIWKKANGK